MADTITIQITAPEEVAVIVSQGDEMLKTVYDPSSVEADVFDRTNHTGTLPASAGATMNADTDVSGNSWVLDEDDMASDSDEKVPTQQSVKTYVANQVDTSCATLIAIDKVISGVDVKAICYHKVAWDDDPDWIEKCGDTSWENEPLNTSARGKTRKFPAEVLIVGTFVGLGSVAITIYDLTDPDVSMWMSFIKNIGNIAGAGVDITGIKFCNGELIFSAANSPSGELTSVNFLTEQATYKRTNEFKHNGNIEQRNDAKGWSSYSSNGIVNNVVNDLAVTLLPNAPINPVTNMRYPTIAVYTDNGLSVIDSVVGTVIDLGTGTKYVSGSVEGGRVFAVDDVGTVDVWDNIPIIDTVAPDTTYSATSIPALLGDVVVTV